MSILDKHPVFVCGIPKSGTTLFMSLLDGHRELLVFPEQCSYLKFPLNGEVQEDDLLKSLFKPEKLPRFKNEKVLGDRINKEKKDYSSINYDHFSESATEFYYNNFSSLKIEGYSDPKIALLAMFEGFSDVSNNVSFHKWILKQTKYEFNIGDIFRDFPDALILYLLRNPIESSLSRTIKKIKKKSLKTGNEDIPKINEDDLNISAFYLEEWKKSVTAIAAAQKEYPSQVLIVRYEQLTENPELVMSSVSDFLNVTWDSSFLEPTFMGNPWRGNSMQDKKYTRIQKNEPRPLPEHLQWQVETVLGKYLSDWGYAGKTLNKRIDFRGLFSLLPGESIASAIKCRAKRILAGS